MSESTTPTVTDPVKVPEKSPEQILAEKQAAYQLELTLLKVRLEEAQEARDLAQAVYDRALQVTSSVGSQRLELEKSIREQAKIALAEFDAQAQEKKKAKTEASIRLSERDVILLDLVSAWERVKGDWIDPNPPVVEVPAPVVPTEVIPPGTQMTQPGDTIELAPAPSGAGTNAPDIEDGPGAAFGSTASDDTGVVEDGDDDEDVGDDTTPGGDGPATGDAPVEGDTSTSKAGIPHKRSKRKH